MFEAGGLAYFDLVGGFSNHVSFGAFLLAWVLWEEDRDLAVEVAPVTAGSVARESGEV